MDSIIYLKKISAILPKPIKYVLLVVWRRWCAGIKWNEQMVSDIANYFKISKKDVKFLLSSSGRTGAFFWNYLKISGKEETFYNITPFYIFELAFWHMTRYQRIFRSKVIELSRGRVLDFGGGMGDLSLELAKRGLSVTYADVSGETFKFAKYLFSKYDLPVVMIDSSKESVGNNYDTIICIDVIEHLENQKETLDMLSDSLNSGGMLIITNLEVHHIDQEQYDNHPMHIPIQFDAKKYILDKGFKETKYPWTFVKK